MLYQIPVYDDLQMAPKLSSAKVEWVSDVKGKLEIDEHTINYLFIHQNPENKGQYCYCIGVESNTTGRILYYYGIRYPYTEMEPYSFTAMFGSGSDYSAMSMRIYCKKGFELHCKSNVPMGNIEYFDGPQLV